MKLFTIDHINKAVEKLVRKHGIEITPEMAADYNAELNNAIGHFGEESFFLGMTVRVMKKKKST